MCSSDCLLVILAILFPPLPVWVKRGICSADSLINIALCSLIHAWYIIAATPDPGYEQVQDQERGTTYIVVQGGSQGYQRRQGQPSYGTVNSTADAQFPGANKGFVQPPPQPRGNAAGLSSDPAPPTYQDAVAGDNKAQRP